MTAIAVPKVKTSEPVTLVHGTVTRGDYRCAGCGYGVSVYRSLPRCPMCGGATWLAETKVRPLHTGPGHQHGRAPGSV